MPKVILTYFNLKGVGEGIRMLLAYGGQEFEDNRIAIEDWPELKPKMPFRQMPVLEIDGKKYAQCLAISRYLGRKFGLSGADIEEDFLIDQSMDCFAEIRSKVAMVYYEPDEKIKATKRAELEKNFYPFMLDKLDQMIKENNGYLAAGKLTWADFVFAGMYDTLKVTGYMPDMDEKYPRFKKLKDTVYSLPKVKAHCDTAPATVY